MEKKIKTTSDKNPKSDSNVSVKYRKPAQNEIALNREQINSQKSSNDKIEEKSFFDLRTTHGQILFLLISISISILIQMLPNDAIRNIFSTNTNRNIAAAEKVVCNATSSSNEIPRRPLFALYGKSQNEGHLRHVKSVLQRLGFDRTSHNSSDWDLLWAHDYPFRTLYPRLHNLRPHQRVNHFPACGFITNKVDLATTKLECIPKAFRLPEDREQFVRYIEENPKKLFVQKHNQHRHIYIKNVSEINFNDNDTFLQEYVDNPLLVDGHKFDIGVYVIITSIDPLRVYIYKGDVLFRYCPVKYYPFDAKNVDKYIVGDDYLPTWDIPSLSPFYNGLGFGMKDSFDAYLRTKGRDPSGIWDQVEDAIRSAILTKEKHLANAVSLCIDFSFDRTTIFLVLIFS